MALGKWANKMKLGILVMQTHLSLSSNFSLASCIRDLGVDSRGRRYQTWFAVNSRLRKPCFHLGPTFLAITIYPSIGIIMDGCEVSSIKGIKFYKTNNELKTQLYGLHNKSK